MRHGLTATSTSPSSHSTSLSTTPSGPCSGAVICCSSSPSSLTGPDHSTWREHLHLLHQPRWSARPQQARCACIEWYSNHIRPPTLSPRLTSLLLYRIRNIGIAHIRIFEHVAAGLQRSTPPFLTRDTSTLPHRWSSAVPTAADKPRLLGHRPRRSPDALGLACPVSSTRGLGLALS